MTIGSASAEPWKFGVMSDTQWTCKDDPAGTNPYAVAKSIIDQINPQFIKAGVKFVIQVGDLTENGNDLDIAERAAAAQPLIDAGIGFFPMRGNHETYANPANNFGIPQFQASFPQTQSGEFTKTNGHTDKRGRNFSSPTEVSTDLAGMSYSFDYGQHNDSARFVILDNWVTPNKSVPHANGYNYGYSIGEQQDWITSRLKKADRGTEHAFVFSHQPLMAENHQDSPFTGYTYDNPDMQNAFFASLANNDVKYYISGHDHIHQRSIIQSPGCIGAGTPATCSAVEEIIGASNSSKFYTPKSLTDSKWIDPVTGVNQKGRETSVSQERYTVGYYIYTVDGPCVTVDYYSDDRGNWDSDSCYPIGTNGATPQACKSDGSQAGSHITPIFNFVKKETWGYCLNGQEFLVPQGATYTTVQDSFEGTTAQILDGTNTSTAEDYNNRPFTKTVNTGWIDVDRWREKYPPHNWHPHLDLASNVFRLSGMADLGSQQTDTYALSLTYDRKWSYKRDGKETFVLVTRDETGRWVNAVDMNFDDGTGNFVTGPYNSSYGLGTYGFDPRTRTAWAVINHGGDFAVAEFGHLPPFGSLEH
jgi:hypothetical protein